MAGGPYDGRTSATCLTRVEGRGPGQLEADPEGVGLVPVAAARGMVVDVAIHNPKASDHGEQPHAHVLLASRRIEPVGFTALVGDLLRDAAPPLCPRPGDPPPDHRTAHRRHDGRAHWQATTTGVAAIKPSRPQDGPWTPQPGGLDPTAATRGYSQDSTAVLSNSGS